MADTMPQAAGNPGLKQLLDMMEARRSLPPSPLDQERQRQLEAYQGALRGSDTMPQEPLDAMMSKMMRPYAGFDPFAQVNAGMDAFDAQKEANRQERYKRNLLPAEAGYKDVSERAKLESAEERAMASKMLGGRGGKGVITRQLGPGLVEVIDASTGETIRQIDKTELVMANQLVPGIMKALTDQGGIDINDAKNIALAQALDAVRTMKGGQPGAAAPAPGGPAAPQGAVAPVAPGAIQPETIAPGKTIPPQVQAAKDGDRASIIADEVLANIAKAQQGDPQAAANIESLKREVASMPPEQQAAVKQRLMAAGQPAPAAVAPVAPVPGFPLKGPEERKRLEGQGTETGKKGVEALYTEYEKVKDLPINVQSFNTAMDAWTKSKSQFGAGAEFFNNAKSFLNNRLGLGLSPEQVADAQVFNGVMGRYAAGQLRQMDSQPAASQLEMIRKAIGTLENDPEAVPKLLTHLHKLAQLQADNYNRRYSQAVQGGFKPINDMSVAVPPLLKRVGRHNGKRVGEFSDGSLQYLE